MSKNTIQKRFTDYECLDRKFTITEDFTGDHRFGRFSFDLGPLHVEGFDTKQETLENAVDTIKEMEVTK